MFDNSYAQISTDHGTVTLPPAWFSYQWLHDPVPGRYWCWDTTQAVQIQEMLAQHDPEMYANFVHEYPIEFFLEPLSGNTVDKQYARSLSTERLNVPLIGVCLPEWVTPANSERVGVVIDGCHRLFRRHELGYDTVTVFQLPDVVEEQIRFSQETVDTLAKLGLL